MLIKFIKYPDAESADMGYPDTTKIIYRSDVVDLDDFVREVDAFIKACGFIPRGELQYVEGEEDVGSKE